ncbi:regulatory recX domain protein, partial [Bacteroides fragilis str. 2-F-2 
MNTITEEEALNRMAAYCSAAEHCKAEVNEKLQKWGLPYEVINRIIDRLVVEKFID